MSCGRGSNVAVFGNSLVHFLNVLTAGSDVRGGNSFVQFCGIMEQTHLAPAG